MSARAAPIRADCSRYSSRVFAASGALSAASAAMDRSDEGIDDLVEDRALVLEVAVKGGVPDADPLGDVGHTGVVIARFGEHLDGRVDDLFPQLQLAPFGIGRSGHLPRYLIPRWNRDSS